MGGAGGNLGPAAGGFKRAGVVARPAERHGLRQMSVGVERAHRKGIARQNGSGLGVGIDHDPRQPHQRQDQRVGFRQLQRLAGVVVNLGFQPWIVGLGPFDIHDLPHQHPPGVNPG